MRLRPCVMLLLHAAMCSIVHVLQQTRAVAIESGGGGWSSLLFIQ